MVFARAARAREQFDWPLFLAVVCIAIMGVVNLYSATSPYIDDPRRAGLADMYVQQVYWLVIGGLFGTLAALIDYRTIERFAYVLYGFGVASLVVVLVIASAVRGSSRWIELGPLAFQPSEFMKLGIVVAIARKLADDPRTEARTLVDMLPAALLFLVP
ncbi:MAG TPA: FtsW/RodA/SpoVE family cell cycle protein, partial [Polyangiaceae bacterium]|nr:FtsW/RodA/SpoVE family cell cycle protein [Polyangiaceae bacterium]